MIAWAILTTAMLGSAQAATDLPSVPFPRTLDYFRQGLRESESRNDVKCWTTFRRIEDMLAARDLGPGAPETRAELVQEFARDAWIRAGHIEAKASAEVSVGSVVHAIRLFFRLRVVTDHLTMTQRVHMAEGEPVVITQTDLHDFGRTSETWRSLLAATQVSGGLARELHPDAAKYLTNMTAIYSLALVRIASRLAAQQGSHEITPDSLRRADRLMRKDGVFHGFYNPESFRRGILAQSIWYAQDKISSLEKVNGKVDAAQRLKTEEVIAGMPLEPEASEVLHYEVLPELARMAWLNAQSRMPSRGYLVTGEEMYQAIRTSFPYSTDVQENTTFFPGSPNATRLLAHDCDSFRDDTLHWKTIENILTREVDADSTSPSTLHAPLNPYAAEELSELLSDGAVLILKIAADPATRAAGGSLTAQDVRRALRTLASWSRSAMPLPIIPPADSHLSDLDPLLARSSAALFVELSSAAAFGLSPRYENEAPDPLDKQTHGTAIEDFDDDGALDVLLGGYYAGLYRNLGGFHFKDVSMESGLALDSATTGGAYGDFNNDGRPDLFLSSDSGASRLYRNRGDGTFEDVSSEAGIGFPPINNTALWLDYDLDGRLDLYVLRNGDRRHGIVPTLGDATNAEPNILYRNNGDGTFTDVTAKAGVGDRRWALGGAVLDFDGDGYSDLYVLNDHGKDVLYRNRRNGTFKDIADDVGVADLGHGMGVSVGDFAHDGRPGLYVTNIGVWNPLVRYIRPNEKTQIKLDNAQWRFFRMKEANHLYRNTGKRFEDVTKAMMDPVRTGWGWNGFFFDADNDGWLDLHVSNGNRPTNLFYHNERKLLLHFDPRAKRFRDVSRVSGVDFAGDSRGGAYADLDGDGYLDLVQVGLHPPKLFRNALQGNGNHWIVIRLRGTRSNRDSVGARVRLTAGGETQTDWVGGQGGNLSSQCPKRLHFGLGRATTIDRLEVRWPSGRRRTVKNVEVDRILELIEP